MQLVRNITTNPEVRYQTQPKPYLSRRRSDLNRPRNLKPLVVVQGDQGEQGGGDPYAKLLALGQSEVIEVNHILILGWSDKLVMFW